jgi:hypothetical protein
MGSSNPIVPTELELAIRDHGELVESLNRTTTTLTRKIS